MVHARSNTKMSSASVTQLLSHGYKPLSRVALMSFWERWAAFDTIYDNCSHLHHLSTSFGSVSKPCTPVVHIKIVGKWMFIPLKFILIGFDPYPPGIDPTLALRLRRSVLSRDVQAFHRRMTAPVVRSHPSEGPQGIHGILLYMVLVTWIPSRYPKC